MISVLIIDDEALARQRIRHLLAQNEAVKVIGECKSGTDAIKSILSEKPDLIFLDIQMKDLTGFDVLQAIPKDQHPMVIFITAYDRYAIKAFDVFAFDYLLKPFKDDRFQLSLSNAINSLQQQKSGIKTQELYDLLDYIKNTPTPPPTRPQMLPLKLSGKISFIDMDQILYIIGSGYYIEIFTADKKYLLRETLTQILAKLNKESFIRIHRSTIINIHYLGEVLYGHAGEIEILMKNGEQFRLSKTYRDDFFSRLGI